MAAKEHTKWLRANGHGSSLAALTGTDARALDAIAACWTLYSVERDPRVLDAVGALLLMMQPKCRAVAQALIPWAMDWSDEGPVWALLVRRQLDSNELVRLALEAYDESDHPLPDRAGFERRVRERMAQAAAKEGRTS